MDGLSLSFQQFVPTFLGISNFFPVPVQFGSRVAKFSSILATKSSAIAVGKGYDGKVGKGAAMALLGLFRYNGVPAWPPTELVLPFGSNCHPSRCGRGTILAEIVTRVLAGDVTKAGMGCHGYHSPAPITMEAVDDISDREVSSKIAASEQVHKDDIKVNGDVNGAYDDNAGSANEDGAGEDESETTAASPAVSDSHTNGRTADDDEAADGEDAADGEEAASRENGVNDEEGMDVDGSDNEQKDEEEPEHDEHGDVSSLDCIVESSVNDGAMDVDEVEEDGKSESGLQDSNSDSVSRTRTNDDGEEDDGSQSAKADDDGRRDDESGAEDDSPPPTPAKSILSNIKGVDSSTPMSKELEDLSKIGARGSLEITLVKKDASSDRNKDEEVDRASEPAILTITDASSKPVDTESTPKKKSDDEDSIIEISPEKGSAKKKKVSVPLNITPRRSSRNLNKTKSYTDKDAYDELDKKGADEDDDDDDVQEVVPTDPLACEADDKNKTMKKTTIVVSDTKRLAEIAAGSKQNRTPSGKKEPTLVIIDTNSILSGKGGIPMSTSLPQMTITPTGNRQAGVQQAAFIRSLNQGTTFITKPQVVPVSLPQVQQPPPPQPKPPIILPSLTDDMYVVEAPSFIVPYVYEKPPLTALKEYITDLEKAIKEQHKEEKEKKRADKEKRKEAELKASAEKAEGGESKGDKADDDEDDAGKNEDEKMEVDDDEQKAQKKKEDDPEFKEDSVKDDKSDTDSDDDAKDSDDTSSRKDDDVSIVGEAKKKSENYFENPLGKFFMQIGVNLVQEHVQTDLLRNQKRKRDKDGDNCPPEVHKAINSLLKTLEYSKENNKPYKLELKKCQLCNFKTESSLVMAHHLETPHMRNYVYRCNFCTLEVRSPHDILLHMESAHNVRGRLERAPAFHQCPNCPFEDGQKGKLSRHLLSCAKKYKQERNQEPPLDWEPPAKIPRVKGARPGIPGSPLYSAASLVPRGSVSLGRMPTPAGHSLLAPRGRGRPPIYINRGGVTLDGRQAHGKGLQQIRPAMVFNSGGRPSNPQQQVLIPTVFNSLYSKGNNPAAMAAASAGATAKLLQQPSISITPLPRQASAPSNQQPTAAAQAAAQMSYVAKPGRPAGGSKTTFVICEICDGYIKDLEQLRNHMQWIHKVKIHPKMIYNRPPLNCQKCQFRFFTDQGLERHLLGSHGLVTSSMQEAANKGKDGGRCPVCGRVYQWKLLNHVARDHNMSLKPAHLSYKCTVCTATFGMYKQFESHVYSAHSVVAKRGSTDKKAPSTGQPAAQPSTSSTSQSEGMLKPLKINDEITIIPQPARAKTKPQQQPAPTKPAKVIEF
ncbi:ZnF_C2H2 [Nesidiocoris tenuis]|uniref:ZnF_C2H2 n=1 Tax=Nesidiocoris tenuis TaxID=355587 RepID=A0ABN7B190_9HEMI|nr:ZnF_C2H2 [Nesidiocoris tenuis]